MSQEELNDSRTILVEIAPAPVVRETEQRRRRQMKFCSFDNVEHTALCCIVIACVIWGFIYYTVYEAT